MPWTPKPTGGKLARYRIAINLRQAMRLSLCFIFMALVGTTLGTAPAGAQWGVDRPGADYANFVVRSGDPASCSVRCERDPRCRAWSFSFPTVQHPAICWLKSQVTPRVRNPCCVSGVKGAAVLEPREPTVEMSIDRPGGDYRHFDIPPDPTGKICADACQADPRCRAWTYARPGYLGAGAARCYLKDRITPPRRRPCCVSGVVR